MRSCTRPQYHRLRRILELIRDGTRASSLPNCGDFTRELEVSRRTLMRDLDFLRDDHHAPIAYDDSRKGFRLTDPTFNLAPLELTQREVFTFSIARKLLERFEGTPLELDMRSVLAKIAESLQGTVSLDLESLTDQFTVLSEDHVRVEPAVWQRAGRAINQRECLCLLFAREVATYIRERIWHPSQELRQRRDGTLELRLETSSRKELTRWILSWMPHVRVLAPQQLRERVRERLRQGLAGCG